MGSHQSCFCDVTPQVSTVEEPEADAADAPQDDVAGADGDAAGAGASRRRHACCCVVGSARCSTAVLVFVLIDVVAGAGAGEEGEEVEVEELEEAKDPVAEAVEGSSCCCPLFPSLVFAGCLALSVRAPASQPPTVCGSFAPCVCSILGRAVSLLASPNVFLGWCCRVVLQGRAHALGGLTLWIHFC